MTSAAHALAAAALLPAPTALADAGHGHAVAVGEPEGASCAFRYTETSAPVLAVGEVDGGPAALVRISGDLVRLAPAPKHATVPAASLRAGCR